jgi:YD repeat-containing protein
MPTAQFGLHGSQLDANRIPYRCRSRILRSSCLLLFCQGIQLMRPGIFLASLLALALYAGEIRCEGKASGADVFRQLSSLVGTWTGSSRNGSAHSVTYRYTAAGSVLVETWTLGSGRESMTLYALDDDRLLATHYCPQGNQPRLEYAGADKGGRWQFQFRDGTNLHTKERSHQQAFWIKLHDDETFERGETYVDNDAASSEVAQDSEAVSYTRVVEKEHAK